MKFLTVQSSPASCHFLLLRSEYFAQTQDYRHTKHEKGKNKRKIKEQKKDRRKTKEKEIAETERKEENKRKQLNIIRKDIG
jgi:hypothetical protein